MVEVSCGLGTGRGLGGHGRRAGRCGRCGLLGCVGAQVGVEGDGVAGGGEHRGCPRRVLVLPVAPQIEREPDPVAAQCRLEQEVGSAQDVCGQKVQGAFHFDLAALSAGDADRLGGHRERPLAEAVRWTVGA